MWEGGWWSDNLLERIPAARVRDGDVWLLNLPELGGNHLPDVKAVRPVFFEGAWWPLP
jgi:N-methylhydantoinase B